jgi:hypothetical protein
LWLLTHGDDRADLVIFNALAAFVNEGPPFSSVVLIEFKRPARNDYHDEENPINHLQVRAADPER